MPTLVEKSEKEIISNLVESLEGNCIEVRLGYDCTKKSTYVSVSVKGSSSEHDYMIKPVIEYVESFDDIERIVSNYLTKDVMEFANIDI